MLEVLKIFVQYATIGGLVLWTLYKFAKYAFGKWFESSLALERQRDQQRHSERMAEINSQFAMMQRREDIRFQQLHPTRIAQLIKTSHALYHIQKSLHEYIGLLLHTTDFNKRDSAHLDLRRMMNEAFEDYEMNKFYFTQSNITYINAVFKNLQSTEGIVGEIKYFNIDTYSRDDKRLLLDAVREGHKALTTDVKQAMLDLHNEIRRTLGVEDQSPV